MVEIGCVEMVNRIVTGETFHAYFNPGRAMPAEAEAVHGLSDAFLADKPTFAERVDELLEFLGDSPLVAHNAVFDFNFLDSELQICGRPVISRTRMIDTIALAKVRHPGAKLSLDALCSRYGVDRSHRTKHGALLDSELLAQVYVELCGGRQIGLELVAETANLAVVSEVVSPRERPFRAPRPHSARPEELALHQAFLATIDTPIWTN